MITAEEAERLLLEWQMSAHSGPYTPSITGSWSRWDHWKRARAFESEPDSLAAPLRIVQLLATWPELEGNAGRRHHVPNGRCLLIPFQPESDQRTDTHIHPCFRCGARRFFPISETNYDCATLTGWSCHSAIATLVAGADRAVNTTNPMEAPDIHSCRLDTRLRVPPKYWTRDMMYVRVYKRIILSSIGWAFELN